MSNSPQKSGSEPSKEAELPAEIRETITPERAAQIQVVPLRMEGKKLILAVKEGESMQIYSGQQVDFLLGGSSYKLEEVPTEKFDQLLSNYESGGTSPDADPDDSTPAQGGGHTIDLGGEQLTIGRKK